MQFIIFYIIINIVTKCKDIAKYYPKNRSIMSFKIARCELHHWEEPVISGINGSGTVFFCGCTMKCKFCQNYKISRSYEGVEVTEDQLLSLFLSLEEEGAHNINLVTPSPYISKLPSLLERFKKLSNLPVVYNTNAYENYNSLKDLSGLVDVYLPDLKYYSDTLAMEYSNTPRYFEIASKNIEEMLRQKPNNIILDGLMKEGVIVRHLVLPTHYADSMQIVDYLSTLSARPIVSIMAQYFPTPYVLSHPVLGKKVTKREYEQVLAYCEYLGVDEGFIQDLESATIDYVPDFDLSLVKKRLNMCKK